MFLEQIFTGVFPTGTFWWFPTNELANKKINIESKRKNCFLTRNQHQSSLLVIKLAPTVELLLLILGKASGITM